MTNLSKKEIEALEFFHETRKVFAALINVLMHKGLVHYMHAGNNHSVVLGESLCRSIMVNGLPSGVQISLPDQLKAIVDCEGDVLTVYRDAISFGMKSLYRNQGDDRILNIVIPTTHAMAQHLRERKTIDIGTYQRSQSAYSIELYQYFIPEYVDASLFDSSPITENWVQLTALGGECVSLEDQGIDITSEYDLNIAYLKKFTDDTNGELDEFYKVALSIRQG